MLDGGPEDPGSREIFIPERRRWPAVAAIAGLVVVVGVGAVLIGGGNEDDDSDGAQTASAGATTSEPKRVPDETLRQASAVIRDLGTGRFRTTLRSTGVGPDEVLATRGTYDLDAGLLLTELFLNPQRESPEGPGDLTFVYTPGSAYMRNPAFDEQVGRPWVRFGQDDLDELSALGDLSAPLDIPILPVLDTARVTLLTEPGHYRATVDREPAIGLLSARVRALDAGALAKATKGVLSVDVVTDEEGRLKVVRMDLAPLVLSVAVASGELTTADAAAGEDAVTATYEIQFEALGEPVTIPIPSPDQVGDPPEE